MHPQRCVLILLFPFLLFSGIINAQSGLQKSISVSLDSVSVAEALLQISEAAQLDITFSPKFFSSDQSVSAEFKSEALSKVLNHCLSGTGIGYEYEAGRITLYRLYYSVSGYVSDASTGEKLVGANIGIPESGIGTYTNSYGYYSIRLPAGTHQFQISYLGYQQGSYKLELSESIRLNVHLDPVLTLEEVVILGSKVSAASNEKAQLPLPTLRTFPFSLGEPDVFRMLDFMPGVQSGPDGYGGISVRGGSNGQNLVLMDDVPIYHPTHTLGLVSIFNPDLVRDVRFYKEGFPARYSGRIASVLDIRNREGNNQKLSGSLGIGTIASQVLVETPIFHNKGAVLIAGRRTHLDPFIQRWGANQKEQIGREGERNYRFFDVNLKSWYKLGEHDKLYLSFYTGGDKYYDYSATRATPDSLSDPTPGFQQYAENEYAYDWGNNMVSLRWNHLFGDRMFSNLTLIRSRFSYSNESSYKAEISYQDSPVLALQNASLFQSNIRKEAVRLDLDYYGNFHHWQMGGNVSGLAYTPGISALEEQVERFDNLLLLDRFSQDSVLLQTLEAGLYVQDRISWNKWEMIAGLHFSALKNSSSSFFAWQPRFQVFYHFLPNWNVHFSGSRMVQFLHLLTTSDAGLPNDLWVPASEAMPPQYAWQAAIGLKGNLKKIWSMELGLFWKEMQNIAQFRSGILNEEATLAINAGNWEEVAFKTDGRSYGLEFLMRRQQGKLRPWLSYTWSKAFRLIENLQLPFIYDHRHRITAAVSWIPDNNWHFSASWQYFSAAPLSPVLEEEQQLSFLQLLPSSQLSEGPYRLPDYHRLDLRAVYSIQGTKLDHELSLGIYNVYNRSNGLFLLERPVAGQNPGLQWSQANGLPILPSIRYNISF